ncbi:MAG: hypothetical protein RL662_565 [Bacteroidota bacterium]|jgi:O-6-methylguanine DNA methyltransferase
MTINKINIETPLGAMIACATNKGLCLLEFDNRIHIGKQLKNLTETLHATIEESANSHLELVAKELDAYFSAQLKSFSIAIDMVGTTFQKSVWEELLNIPHGRTISYLQQAVAINKPKGARAVANANGKNKIAIVIPCHRVIGSNATLTGYAGGLDRKKWLLNFESGNTGLFD